MKKLSKIIALYLATIFLLSGCGNTEKAKEKVGV